MAAELCEACRVNPIEVVDDRDDLEQPYRVCLACDHRLQNLSLRPLEWFNLASCHGPNKFLLHDDFYYDNGNAGQPEEKVVAARQFAAPTLEQVKADLERLVDYTMTLFWLHGHRNVVNALRRHDPAAVLEVLKRRVALTSNVDIASMAYEVCARVLGKVAQAWVREQWANNPPRAYHSLAEATAACLPFEEGFTRVSVALEGLSIKELSDHCHAFAPFRSRLTLDWMEAHEGLIVHDAWGRVAAQSHFSWSRAESWLARGRPLSLRALYAIISCYHYDTIPLKEVQPKLEEQALLPEMVAVLDDYLQEDPVPNVRRRVEVIKGFWKEGA